MNGRKLTILYPASPEDGLPELAPIQVTCITFRRVLPMGETEGGGWRDQTLLQFWSDHGMRTVAKANVVRVR